jgi:hypothetical protein
MYFLLGDFYQLGQGSSLNRQYWLVQVDSAGMAATAIHLGIKQSHSSTPHDVLISQLSFCYTCLWFAAMISQSELTEYALSFGYEEGALLCVSVQLTCCCSAICGKVRLLCVTSLYSLILTLY